MSVKVKENKPGGQCKSLKSTSVLLDLGLDLGLDHFDIHGNISFDVLGHWAFQKYSTIRFLKIFWAW